MLWLKQKKDGLANVGDEASTTPYNCEMLQPSLSSQMRDFVKRGTGIFNFVVSLSLNTNTPIHFGVIIFP